MHKLWKKGIALVMGAAVVLGALGLGATPVKAATKELTYTLDQLELGYKADECTISGTDFSWTDHWGNVFFKVPQAVQDAGFVGFRVEGSASAPMYWKYVELDKWWKDGAQNGEKWINSGTFSADAMCALKEDHDAAKVTGIGFMSLGDEGDSMTAVIEKVIFTVNAVASTTDDPTDDPADDPADDSATGSPAAGESPTAIAAADKKAWDDAKAEIDAGTKKEVSVTLKADTTLPKTVLESLAGKDVTLKIDLGKNIVWTIKGTDVKAADAKDVNLKVTLDAGSIPADTMKAAAKGNDYKKVQLAYDGQFGFKAVLTIKVDTKYKGKYGQLFYYNTTDKKMEYISSGKVADDGKVDLTFTHASDYIIVLADQETPKTADVNWGVWVVMLVLAGNMVLLAGYGALLKNKRNIFS